MGSGCGRHGARSVEKAISRPCRRVPLVGAGAWAANPRRRDQFAGIKLKRQRPLRRSPADRPRLAKAEVTPFISKISALGLRVAQRSAARTLVGAAIAP